MTNSLSALDFFTAKLAFEVGPEELATLRASGAPTIVVDTRPLAAWTHSRVPGAVHLPADEIAARAVDDLPDEDADIVLYTWGPGHTDAARSAIALLRLGFTSVRELNGGFDLWVQGGYEIESDLVEAVPLAEPVPMVEVA